VRVRIAFAALGAAAALLAWTLWRALRIEDVRPVVAVSARDTGSEPDLSVRETYSVERVLAAVDKDPFHPERRRPALRYHLPGDGGGGRSIAAQPAPGVRVVGTAVAAGGGGGGFAMCAWAGGSPRIVRVGERVGDWTLSKVTPGAAEFTAPTGATVIVRIAKAGT
jgi:hypothetical protein